MSVLVKLARGILRLEAYLKSNTASAMLARGQALSKQSRDIHAQAQLDHTTGLAKASAARDKAREQAEQGYSNACELAYARFTIARDSAQSVHASAIAVIDTAGTLSAQANKAAAAVLALGD